MTDANKHAPFEQHALRGKTIATQLFFFLYGFIKFTFI